MPQLTFYYLRTPRIALTQLLDGLDRMELTAFIQQPIVAEAICLASPALYEQIMADPDLSNDQLRQTVLKYILRMGSRSTPFGLFAGCSVGKIGPHTSLDVANWQLNCHYRLSAPVLTELLQHLHQQPQLRQAFCYQVNTSLYSLGRWYRYVEIDTSTSPASFFTSQLKKSPALRVVLELARQPKQILALVDGLVQQGYDESESKAFVEQLIADQVLVSELTMNVTGIDPLTRLTELFRRIPAGDGIWPGLEELRLVLADTTPVQLKMGAVRNLLQRRFTLHLPNIPLLQGDSLFTGSAHTLSTSLLEGLGKNLQKVFGLSRAFGSQDSMLDFKKAFYKRYEEQEIPLALALDAESGIGYGSQPLASDRPILEALFAAGRINSSSPESAGVSPAWDEWVRKRYEHWQAGTTPVLDLTDADLAVWPASSHDYPDSYYAFGYFLADSSSALDAGQYRFRSKLIGGPTAFPLLGRFCSIDEALSQQVQQAYHRLQKQHPERIYAEIVHLPTAAVGNVVQRPHLSEFEIPYLGYSTLPLDKQIPITDLYISVPRGERIVLRSRRLGKEIKPRLTTAHNYRTGLPLYQFLCDLQQQENALAVQWHWGSLSGFRYLPRVQYRQIILQEARWRLDWQEYDASKTLADNVNRWRQLWHWPRYVALAQGDQELFLDLDQADCQQLLVSTLRRLASLEVIEWLRTPDQCCVKGPDGSFNHEVILPFIQSKPTHRLTLPRPSTHRVKRTFIPGSEWLYLKLYGGPQVSQQLLIRLRRQARSWIRAGKVSHWFFIRYEDPELHLRFRFHLVDKSDYADLLSACQRHLQVWIDTGELHRVQVDTYQRELERYGPERIEQTERLFWADSETVLSLRQEMDSEPMLLTAALLGSDRYLTDFGLSPAEKVQFCQQYYQALFAQQGAQLNVQKQLATLYRQHASILNSLSATGQPQSLATQRCIHLLNKRSRLGAPYRPSYGLSADQLETYVASLIHLFINRLFEQHPHRYELLVYHHLSRFYQGQTARALQIPQSIQKPA